MKKISLISAVLLIAAAIIMAFTFSDNLNRAELTTTVNVHVTGCGNDCSHLQYCLSDGTVGYPGSCDFTIIVPDGTYTLCVKCYPPVMDAGGQVTFSCTGGTIDVKMPIGELKNCECDSKKIKK